MKTLKKWDIFYINDNDVYFAKHNIDKQRPCLAIAIAGNNIIFSPLTTKNNEAFNEFRSIELSTKLDQKCFINLSHIFTINVLKTNIFFKNQKLNFLDRWTVQKNLNKLLKSDSLEILEEQKDMEIKTSNNIPFGINQNQTQSQTGDGNNNQTQSQSVNINKKGDN